MRMKPCFVSRASSSFWPLGLCKELYLADPPYTVYDYVVMKRSEDMVSHKSSPWTTVLFLTTIEQGLKVIINNYYLLVNAPILRPWLFFNPVFNRDYSWFNSMLQLNIGRWIHVLLVTALLILIYLFHQFVRQRLKTDRLIDATFAFLFAGAICSLIDKVFWNGSLDYIRVRGMFTFDLKDVYINIFVGLFILMVAINHRGIRQVKEDEIVRDFVAYVRRVAKPRE